LQGVFRKKGAKARDAHTTGSQRRVALVEYSERNVEGSRDVKVLDFRVGDVESESCPVDDHTPEKLG